MLAHHFSWLELFEGWNRDDDDRRRYKTFVRDRALTAKWMAIRQKTQRKSHIFGEGRKYYSLFYPSRVTLAKEGFFISGGVSDRSGACSVTFVMFFFQCSVSFILV